MSELHEISSLQFLQETINSNDVVVVEFGAEWCGPCKKFLPHFVQLAERRHDIVCVKVDVDSDPGFIAEYKIQSVPQVMLFRNGTYERHLESRTVIKLLAEIDN